MTPSEPVRCVECGQGGHLVLARGSMAKYRPRVLVHDFSEGFGWNGVRPHRFVPPTPKEVRLIDLEHREEYGEEVRE